MYSVAATAKEKLGTEVSRPDHRLRMLVGTANLLDALMEDIVDAERKRKVTPSESRKLQSSVKIQWVEQIPEDDEIDNETDSDVSDEDFGVVELALSRSK